MSMMKLATAALRLAVLMPASSAWAHDSFAAEFDIDKPIRPLSAASYQKSVSRRLARR